MSDIISLNTNAQRLYQRGGKASYSGNYLDAVFYYKQAVKAEPENVEYLSDLSSALNQIAHYEDSIIYATRALLLTKDTDIIANLYYLLGEAYMGISMLSEAYNMLNRSIYTNPNGQFARDAELLLVDIAEYSTVETQKEINDADYYFKLSAAEFQYYNHQYEDALKTLEEFEAIYGADANSKAIKIQTLIALEKYKDALRLIQKIIKVNPEEMNAIAYGLLAAKNITDEVKLNHYKKLLMEISDYSENDINLISEIFDKTNETELAYQFFLKLYKDNNYDFQIIHGLAAACYNKKDIAHAQQYWNKLGKLEGSYGIARYYLDHMGNMKETITCQYTATAEMMEEYQQKINEIMANAEQLAEETKTLCELVHIVLLYQNAAEAETLLTRLPLQHMPLQRVLRELLLSFTMPMQSKLLVIKYLEDNGAQKPFLINLGNTITDSSVIFENENNGSIKKIEMNERLMHEYTPEQLYYGVMSFSMLGDEFTFSNNELSLCVELIICQKYHLPKEGLEDIYHIDKQRLEQIEGLLRESGIIEYETV